MKKKGFTLIELLAVIVILGIITVIAVPKILDIINKSRESASNSSIKLIKDAIKTQVASSDLTGPVFTKETDGCYIFNFDDQTSGNTKSLEIKNKDKVSGSIKYCNNTFSDDTLKFDGKSINKDEEKGKIICKRATTLHMDSTHTFGNLGKSGTLSSGDAFDCDVNGDEVYDPETERFYYVSDYYNTRTKSFDNDTAVLIYYNNTSSGTPSNNTKSAYDSSNENWHGPVTAITQLPTTNEWSNVSLKNTSRAILSENESNTTIGGTLPDSFSYQDKVARLLTASEINAACGIKVGGYVTGELDSCSYLMENTTYSGSSIGNYGYWIENPLSGYSKFAWHVDSYHHYVGDGTVSSALDYGVRPVIEISKKNIDY